MKQLYQAGGCPSPDIPIWLTARFTTRTMQFAWNPGTLFLLDQHLR